MESEEYRPEQELVLQEWFEANRKLVLGIGLGASLLICISAGMLYRQFRKATLFPKPTMSAVGVPMTKSPDSPSFSLGPNSQASLPVPSNPLSTLSGWHPNPIPYEHGPEDPPRVALTFDAGSDAKAVPIILKELEARHVRCTFFLTGRFCEQFPAECRMIADAGMEIGNHSYRHPHFTRLTETQIKAELEKGEAAIVKACGRGAKPLFRFPYGDCDRRTDRIVADAGYQPIRWTLDSLDAFQKPKTVDFVTERINGRIKPGYITLMHVSCVTSGEALPRIFEKLDSMGAKVVPVSELLLSQQTTQLANKSKQERSEPSLISQ